MGVLDDFVFWIYLCMSCKSYTEKLLFENFRNFLGKPLKEVQF